MTTSQTEPRQRKQRSPEIVLVRVQMLSRGWNNHDLARATGLSPRVVANVLAENNTSWPPRAAINAALGAEIFTKPAPSVPAIPQSHPLRPHDRMLRASQIVTRPLPHS